MIIYIPDLHISLDVPRPKCTFKGTYSCTYPYCLPYECDMPNSTRVKV